MNNNYFAIEYKGYCLDHCQPNNDLVKEFSNMSYEDILKHDLDEFICNTLDYVETSFDYEGEEVIVTLIGEDDIFIWSVVMQQIDDENVKYVTYVEW